MRTHEILADLYATHLNDLIRAKDTIKPLLTRPTTGGMRICPRAGTPAKFNEKLI